MPDRRLEISALGALASMFVICNRDLQVEALGPGWATAVPAATTGGTLGDLLRVVRPITPLTFEELLRRGGSGLMSQVIDGGLPLQGPVQLAGDDALVYLASPRITVPADLAAYRLTLSDLPLADRDFLFALQLKDTAIADAERAAGELSAQRTREQEAIQAMGAQLAVTRVLAEARDLAAAAAPLVEAICNVVGWNCGAVWRLDRRDQDRMYCVDTWTRDSGPASFAAHSRTCTFRRGTGLPGRVWESGQLVWIEDVTMDGNFPRAAAAAEVGLRAAFALPILVTGADGHPEVTGVIEAFGQQSRPADPRIVGALVSLGSQVGQFLERRQSEAALRESEERTRLIIDSALDAVVTMDMGGVIREWNAQAERTFGWTKAEAIGRDLGEVLVPERLREAHRVGLRRNQATGESTVLQRRLEMPARHRDGREFMVELSIAPVYRDQARTGEAGGRPVLYSGFLRDITQRVEAEQELRRAKEAAESAAAAKSEFLATMSHEIRTPMNAIIGLTGLLMEADLPESERAYVTTVRDAGESLLAIINDILDFSKVEASRLELEAIACEPRALVDDVVELFAPSAAAKGLTLDVAVSPDVPAAVMADPGRLRQVLSNLVSNAIKFTSEGRVRITLEAPRVDDVLRLRFTVSDTGIGIEPEVLPRLFQPFSQADTSMNRRYGGTGLGLAISDRLVKLMGGTLTVKSVPEQGSTFVVELKVDAATLPFRETVERRVPMPQPVVPGAMPRARALVVEDNPANQMVAVALLRRFGVLADQASNGVEALRAVARGRYDLILMDCQMPGMDGYTATRQIRARGSGEGPRVPIVAMTANVLPGERERCLAAGMDDYLAKPVRVIELADALERWVPTLGVAAALDTTPPSEAASARQRLASMKELLGEDWEESHRVFVTHSRETLGALQAAVERRDAAAVAHLAHLLRGGCAMMGATTVESLAATLEEEAQGGRGRERWGMQTAAMVAALDQFIATAADV
jgi:PAS domain S-box-containing protein